MSAPFEKFVVHSNDVNTFVIRTTSPEAIREILHADASKLKELNDEYSMSKTMLHRCLFIEDAIREKLERERKP